MVIIFNKLLRNTFEQLEQQSTKWMPYETANTQLYNLIKDKIQNPKPENSPLMEMFH